MPRFEHLEFEEEHPRDELEARQRSRAEAELDERRWLRKADENRRRGHYENALRLYSRALERDRSIVIGWLGQVQMLVLLGEEPEAELWARKALELFKNQGDLMAGRAQALHRMGDRKQAGELADAALRQEGLSAYRWMVRGELMGKAGKDVDRHCFDKAVQLDADWLVPLEIALIYLYLDLPSKALPRAQAAVEKAPDCDYCWYIQGRCYEGLDLTKQASKSYERCLQVTPNHIEARRRIDGMQDRGWSLGRGLRRLFGGD